MKLEELLKNVDFGVVEEITIYYCGGRIKIEPNNAPIETKDERGASDSVNWENAEKAADTLRKYCAGFKDCTKNCIFYRAGLPCCALKFPYEYDIKEETADGGKS